MVNLMNRLSMYLKDENNKAPEGVDIFNLFKTNLALITQRQSADVTSLLDLQVAFLNFTLSLYPDQVQYMDDILSGTVNMLLRYLGYDNENAPPRKLNEGVTQVTELLTEPLKILGLKALSLDNVLNLMQLLDFNCRKEVSIAAIQIVLGIEQDNGPLYITEEEELRSLLRFISPLIQDEDDDPERGEPRDQAQFWEEQVMVCKVLSSQVGCYAEQNPADPDAPPQIIQCSTDQQIKLCSESRKFFGHGGPKRMKLTIQTLCNKVLGLVTKVRNQEMALESGAAAAAPTQPPAAEGGENAEGAANGDAPAEGADGENPAGGETAEANGSTPAAANANLQPLEYSTKKLFQFIHKSITSALNPNAPEVAVCLWMKAAAVANTIDMGTGNYADICAEFLEQGLSCFEEEVTEMRGQFKCINLIVGTLQNMSCIDDDTYESFAGKITLHSAKLLKKPQQCKAVNICSHLFWNKNRQMSAKVQECLQKCLKTAEACVQNNPSQAILFIEIFDSYIYYFEHGCTDIQLVQLSTMREICMEHCRHLQQRHHDESWETIEYFKQILAYLRFQKTANPAQYGELDENILYFR